MQIIGHRGASGYVTENTMAAFTHAFELGCDMIELDVHVCKSGELAVFHDFSLKEFNNVDLNISSISKSEINRIMLPRDHKIPFLDEVLDNFANRLMINIELKGESTSLPVYLLLEQFKSEGRLNIIPLISSLQFSELINFRKKSEYYPLGWIVEEVDDNTVEKAVDLKLTSIHPSLQVASRKFISECHDRGLVVYVFTVNEKRDFDRLLGMGVDGVFTDYPDRFI